ncbi:hypothetical protein ACEPPN_008018 [Leptodophora sp. 'Broadleaf-Isolate-01']
MANDGSSTGQGYDWKAYRYDPSLVAAIIFIVCFVLTTFFHLYQLVRTRTWYFIPLCIGGFCGGILSSGSLSSVHLGEKIVIIGLFVQIIFFGCFAFVALSFNVRIHKVPTEKAHQYHGAWHKHINTLYAASFLIMVRSVFRVVEYIQGNDGYLLRHEYYLYIFDAVLMLAVMVIFNFIHPSEVKALLKGGRMAKGLKMYSVK